MEAGGFVLHCLTLTNLVKMLKEEKICNFFRFPLQTLKVIDLIKLVSEQVTALVEQEINAEALG